MSSLFFFNDTATTEIYTLSLHDALPIHAGEAGAQGAFYEDYPVGPLDFQDRHAAYGGVLLGIVGGGVDDVVGADDDRGVRVVELGVYVLEVVELFVGDADLGQEHVHVPGHAARDGVDAKEHLLALRLKELHQVVHGALSLGDRESVAGYDHHLLRLVREVLAYLLGTRVVDRSLLQLLFGGARGGDAGEDDLAQRPSQGARHQAREDRARRPDDGAPDDEDVVLEHEPRRGRGEARKGVEERDYDGHVRSAYRYDEQDAQDERDHQDRDHGDHRREEREYRPIEDGVRCEYEDAHKEQRVHELLQRKRDGAGKGDLLELGERQ